MPNSVKVGRNDPCPCGSGKKYKRCCLAQAKAAGGLQDSVNAAFHRMQSALVRFAMLKFGELTEFAWSDYNFGEPDESLESAPAADLDLFTPYFLYRWKPWRKKLPSGDRSIAHAFLRMRGDKLSELERQVIELSLSQPVTFYEVMSVVPGQEFTLKEVLTGKECQVKERSGSRLVGPGHILYGQLAPMPGITTMAFCASFAIPPRMKPEIIMLRRELREERGRPLTTKDLLKYEIDLRDVFFYIHDTLHRPPVLCNTDNERLVLQTLRYQVGSAQVAFDALAPLAKLVSKKDLLRDATLDAQGNLRQATIQWMKKGNRKMKNWDNTVLGTIRISGRSLAAEVNSNERAARLRREIEERLGLAAVYQGTEVTPFDMKKMWNQRGKKPPRRDEPDKILKDPQAQQMMRDVLQKQVESWTRTKIPALGGRTPLQAVRSADGREMVEALILDYEQSNSRSYPQNLRPDMNAVRRLLKLPTF